MIKMLINGEMIEGNGSFQVVYNPSNGKEIIKYKGVDKLQAKKAITCSKKTFNTWSKTSLIEREKYIREIILELYNKKQEIIDLLMKETGKPLKNAIYDFEMLPNCLNYFIEEAKRINGQVIPDYDNNHYNLIEYCPKGVVVGYLAWNFPILNLGYKLGPILASGCTCVLKPSSVTPLSTLFIGEIISKILPAGVVNIICGKSSEISYDLNANEDVSLITLIGSSNTGKQIIKESSSSIKDYSLELGGNAPALVFEDADLEKAVNDICGLKFDNAGQICVSPNRVFVHKKVIRSFIEKAKEYISRITLDCGDDTNTIMMGPLSSKKSCNRMLNLIDDAIEKGAKLIVGGKLGEEGYFFEPTILTNVNSTMKVYKEEIFGPIMSIIEFEDSDDIVKLANDTEYGLASYIYSKDFQKTLLLAKKIDSGSVCINEPNYNYNLPHGGVKQSGIGKDCSRFSLLEYYDVKRISIKINNL